MRLTTEDNQRAAVLRDLERSGLSMAEYCRRHGLAYSTLASWRSARRREAAVRFVEVEADVGAGDEQPEAGSREAGPQSESRLCVELTLPGGAVLRVFSCNGNGGAS